MALISQRKEFALIKLETIIKRCPICLKDTVQQAYYAQKPDLSVIAITPTDPPIEVKLSPELEHGYEWYVVAKCAECTYSFKVMGVPRMKVKDIPKESKNVDLNLALACCDICYNEDFDYKIGNIFINLSDGKKVYLCSKHAEGVENDKKKTGSYKTLSERIDNWKDPKEQRPRVIFLKNGKKLLFTAPTHISLLTVLKDKPLSPDEILTKLREKGNVINQDKLDEILEKLKGLSLLVSEKKGLIIKKEYVSLTEDGNYVVLNLQNN